jgi:hypothetical protein
MDERPFFIFNTLEYSDQDFLALEKFSAEKFSVEGIVFTASDLKLKSLMTDALKKEFASPSDDFVRMIGRRIHEGNLTAEVRTRFSSLISSCISDILRDQASQRLKEALDRSPQAATPAPALTPLAPPPAQAAAVAQNGADDSVKTTEEEFEAFRIIRAILRKDVDVKRVAIRDAASYCAILFDDNNRKPIARLYLEGKKKRIGIFQNKSENRFDVDGLDDIYRYSDELRSVVLSYLQPNGQAAPAP